MRSSKIPEARLLRLAAAALLLGLAACQTGTTQRALATSPQAPQAVQPQPAAAALQPGLAVEYLRVTANDVDEVEQAGRGRAGPPLLHLQWDTREAPVLTSTENANIAARITGLIHLAAPGSYRFRVRSNDGFRAEVGGVRVLEDPGVHATRWSDVGSLDVAAAGWYPLYIVYFQKAGTAALELHWQVPGASGLSPVPAAALAHIR